MRPAEEIDDVEDDRQGPGTNRDIGDDRVERVAQPGAVNEGLEVSSGFAEQFVGATDDLLKEIGDRLEPSLAVDKAVDDVIEQRRLLSEDGDRRK